MSQKNFPPQRFQPRGSLAVVGGGKRNVTFVAPFLQGSRSPWWTASLGDAHVTCWRDDYQKESR